MGISTVDDATMFGFSSGQGGWIEAKGGSRALIWVTELQLLVYDYRGSRHGLASEALTTFVFDQYFLFLVLKKTPSKQSGVLGWGEFTETEDWIGHAAVMKGCAIPSIKDKREIHGDEEVGS